MFFYFDQDYTLVITVYHVASSYEFSRLEKLFRVLDYHFFMTDKKREITMQIINDKGASIELQMFPDILPSKLLPIILSLRDSIKSWTVKIRIKGDSTMKMELETYFPKGKLS